MAIRSLSDLLSEAREVYQQNMDNQKRSQDTIESNSKKRRANNSDINAKQVGVKKEDWPFEDDWLDEYALTEEFNQLMEAAERMQME